jgi:hypothetical protein
MGTIAGVNIKSALISVAIVALVFRFVAPVRNFANGQ